MFSFKCKISNHCSQSASYQETLVWWTTMMIFHLTLYAQDWKVKHCSFCNKWITKYMFYYWHWIIINRTFKVIFNVMCICGMLLIKKGFRNFSFSKNNPKSFMLIHCDRAIQHTVIWLDRLVFFQMWRYSGALRETCWQWPGWRDTACLLTQPVPL